MQANDIAYQYSNAKSMLMLEAAGLNMEFPGTDMLLLVVFLKENSCIYDFKTSRFASIVTHPESKRLIVEYLSAPDAESSDNNNATEPGKADDGDIQDEVPMFRFKRAENGSMAIMDKERYDLLFPQFKRHLMRKAHNALRKADVLFLSARAGVTPVCYWSTPRFWPLIRDPENKNLILRLMEGSDTESTPDAQSSGVYQDEVPKFEFKRAGLGHLAIMDQAKHDILFPQFKARAIGTAIDLSKIPGEEVLVIATSGPDMVAAFATPKLMPFLTQPEGWNAIKAHLQEPLVDIDRLDFFELFRLCSIDADLDSRGNILRWNPTRTA
ncbi:hypothetical protein BGZ70_000645 [Mortierella alpina]|uniref:Uncharacterized protein n=1 Tax=Mortierella alpina TaxID=64518 RepID=A0A9P6IXF6_MORAP|nr:hypothetical protein BGZ70_000645 [Mortierella alpina]